MTLPAAVSLTDKQAEFVRQVAQGVSRVKAAELAGYEHPGVEPSRLLALPHIQAALKREHARILSSELAPLAIGRLKGLLQSKTTSDSNVIKAADLVLKAAGLHKSAADPNDPSRKALSDMGQGELEDLVGRLRQAVSAHEAKTIDAVPVNVTEIDPELDKLCGD